MQKEYCPWSDDIRCFVPSSAYSSFQLWLYHPCLGFLSSDCAFMAVRIAVEPQISYPHATISKVWKEDCPLLGPALGPRKALIGISLQIYHHIPMSRMYPCHFLRGESPYTSVRMFHRRPQKPILGDNEGK